MQTSPHKVWRLIGLRLLTLVTLCFLSATSVWAASANISTDNVNISAGQSGSFTISGNDSGNESQFRWTLPSGLNVSKGSSSNLRKFDIKTSKGYVKIESSGNGNFSATINVSSNNNGTFSMNNIRAEINLNPRNVTVNVGGGGGNPPPPGMIGVSTPGSAGLSISDRLIPGGKSASVSICG